MTLAMPTDHESAVADLIEEIRITGSIISHSRAASAETVTLKTHIRGILGSGKYAWMPHWELKDVLPHFELPRSWKLFHAFTAEHSTPVFWLRGGITPVMNTRNSRGLMTTTHELPLESLSVSDLNELSTGVHHLQGLVISIHQH